MRRKCCWWAPADGNSSCAPTCCAPLLAIGIGVEIMDTHAASRTYNILMAEGRRVVVALIPPNGESQQ